MQVPDARRRNLALRRRRGAGVGSADDRARPADDDRLRQLHRFTLIAGFHSSRQLRGVGYCLTVRSLKSKRLAVFCGGGNEPFLDSWRQRSLGDAVG